MKRPLWLIGPLYAGALLAGIYMGITAAAAGAAAVIVVFLAGVLISRRRRAMTAFSVAMMAIAAGLLAYALTEYTQVLPLRTLDGSEQTVTVRVMETPIDRSKSDFYRVRTTSDDASVLPTGTLIRLYLPSPHVAPDVGDVFSTTVRLSANAEEIGSDYADGVYLTGLCTVYYTDDVTLLRQEPLTPLENLTAYRRSAVLTTKRWLPGDAGALVAGICLGETGYLSDEAAANLRGAGLSHLVAVSGLHLSLIALTVRSLLRRLMRSRLFSTVLTAGVTVLFMALTGFSGSVCRAGIMMLLYLLADLIGRRSDGLNSLGGALLVLCLIQPRAVCDIGLLLSFTATTGLLVLSPRINAGITRILWSDRRYARVRDQRADPIAPPRRRPRLLGWPIDVLSATLGATLAMLPVIVLTFRTLTLTSPLTNLLSVFPASWLLYLALPALLLSPIGWLAPVCRWFILVAGCLSRYLLAVACFFANLPLSVLHLRYEYQILCLCGVLILLAAALWHDGRRSVRRALALAAAVICCGTLTRCLVTRDVTTLTVWPDSAAVLIESNGHEALLVVGDAGDGLNEALYDLRDQGVQTLDFVLLTDPTERDYPELSALCERYTVEDLILPDADALPLQNASVPLYSEQQMPLTFWNGAEVEMCGGWTRLTFGDSCVEVCSDAATPLPSDWTDAGVVLFTNPPSEEMLNGLTGAKAIHLAADGPEQHAVWTRLGGMLTLIPADLARVSTRGDGQWSFFT